VRQRAVRILEAITQADFLARLDAFAADLDGKQTYDLPAWDLFRAVAGEDRNARAVFVMAQRAEPRLLQALAKDSKQAEELFALRFVEMQQSLQSVVNEFGESEDELQVGSIAALLLAGGAENVTIAEDAGVQLNPWMYQSSFQEELGSADHGRPLRKLLAGWILKDNGPNIAFQNLRLAHTHGFHSEGLTIALRALNKNSGHITLRQFALMYVGLHGGRKHVRNLQPLLKESTPAAFQPPPSPSVGAPRPLQMEIRDVALAVCLHLTGQKASDYGFIAASLDPGNPDRIFSFSSQGFADAVHREAALKKWDEWFAAHDTP
jgi:hypothetical protein